MTNLNVRDVFHGGMITESRHMYYISWLIDKLILKKVAHTLLLEEIAKKNESFLHAYLLLRISPSVTKHLL